MYKKLLLAAVTGMAMLIGCKKEGESNLRNRDKNDEGFGLYKEVFLEELWKTDPDRATLAGNHTYDSLLVLPSEYRKKMLDLAKVHLDSLSRYPEAELSDANRMDFSLIQNFLRATQWNLQQLKPYEWDPTFYNATGTFAYILNEPYAPLTARLKGFNDKLGGVPEYFKEAQKSLKNPVPELTSLAIAQLTAASEIIEKDFADSVHNSGIPEVEEKVMIERAKLAAASIRSFTTWLKSASDGKGRSFRLGKELYEDKLQQELQPSFTGQQIFNSAMERKKVIHKQMIKLAKQLWPTHMAGKSMPSDSLEMVGEVIAALSAKHAGPEQFKAAIQQHLPTLTTFVQSKDLITTDPAKQLIIRKKPAYLSHRAGTFVTSPGPYEKTGKFYYNIINLASLDKEKADSYLREYNDYTLQLLNIYEAIPGRYTQLALANGSPSMVKAIFANDAMTNGWAVYAGEVMIDAGYENTPEMRLMWNKWHLRAVCDAILDYSVHTGAMTKAAALKLLTKEAFQEEMEAENKWTTVTLSSVKLASGFTGYKEIIELRNAYKKKMADKYKLKDFHDKFLSYGSAPVKYIKEAMLAKEKQPETAN
ncbi:DUF885 domain-containing protein [Mucilaginibacter hurinus]|uniref:DUF885 domain-containing protein n=1 Tax=Mucilaginibacter hurinus TaxID=2201324 RepID=A0A367GLK2_9SPHI|nr:DUF885 domain-containing protein [Mucilaginibacter hurinus]RCH54339.1 DUF885 domain-containing protein [Mucilaginibacter hurinus]